MNGKNGISSLVICLFILSACATPFTALPTETVIIETVPPATMIVSPTLKAEKNIALGKPVSSSKQLNTNPAWMATDSNNKNWWGSGDFAPQWIEIELNGLYSISKIRLITSQSPSGETVHHVLGKGMDGKYIPLHVFSQFTGDGQALEIVPETPWTDISSIKIETVKSPSWVSWKEVMIYSREDPKELPATQTPAPVATTKPQNAITSNDRLGVIAFYTRGKNSGGIAVIRADGSSEVSVLSVHPTSDSKPAWSPDGSKIAFESLRDDVVNLKHMDIYIMNADGSHLARLTNSDGVYSEPDWSPDGKQLLVSANKDGDKNTDLYLLDVESRQETRLTTDPGVDADPSWSPDGSKIAFTSNRDGRFNIHVLEVKTGKTIQLTHDTGDNARPDWSPDEKSILFISNRDKYVEIYLMDADGGNQTRLTNSPDYKSEPEWSPDGKYFAYTRGKNEDGDIYIMGFDGSDPVLLYKHDGSYDGYVAWSGTAVITDEPMFGPLMCMRDTNGDMKPDAVTNTFLTTDQFPYIMFPYRNIDPNVVLSTYFNYEKSDMDMMNMSMKWEYGENGLYMSSPSGASLSMVDGAQNLTIQVSINGVVVQEIECPIVEP